MEDLPETLVLRRGDWRLEIALEMEIGDWRLEIGDWRLEMEMEIFGRSLHTGPGSLRRHFNLRSSSWPAAPGLS